MERNAELRDIKEARRCYNTHFTEKTTEAQRGSKTHSGSHSSDSGRAWFSVLIPLSPRQLGRDFEVCRHTKGKLSPVPRTGAWVGGLRRTATVALGPGPA